MTTALITGLNGQDGSYLAEFLLEKGYDVIGTVRGKNPKWPDGFNPDHPNLRVKQLDLGYFDSIRVLFENLKREQIDECYNLAAQSHVGASFTFADETYKVTGVGACLLMDDFFGFYPKGKFYQASTSEMFGNQDAQVILGLSKDDPFYPESPYAVAKTMAHYNAIRHLNNGNFAYASILFNHESERRHESFVTQKICKKAVEIYKWVKESSKGISPVLSLGNTSTMRDWGYAPEYTEVIWKMVQNNNPETCVIGTGVAHSVHWFVERVFDYLGLPLEFQTYGYDLTREHDIDCLKANPEDFNKLLGRKPTYADELVKIMVDNQKRLQGVE